MIRKNKKALLAFCLFIWPSKKKRNKVLFDVTCFGRTSFLYIKFTQTFTLEKGSYEFSILFYEQSEKVFLLLIIE